MLKAFRGVVLCLGFACVGLGCGGSSQVDDDNSAGSAGESGEGGSSAGAGKSGSGGKGGASGKGGAGGVSGRAAGGTGGVSTGAQGGIAPVGGAGSIAPQPLQGLNAIRTTEIDKVDLLIMIDNSGSMAIKQALLADAIPVLAERLTAPRCVDGAGTPNGERSDENGHCESGAPEFEAIRNLHVGIITSSLGDHGSADVCSAAQDAANQVAGQPPSRYNDLAQLLPSVRQGLESWNNSGFLVWDPRDQAEVSDAHTNLGETGTEPSAFGAALKKHAAGVGENGCGYEASLEAWYRFLVDPEPVATMSNDRTTSTRGIVNQVVLAQRAMFLRRDSALVIVMLSDENDCSVIDESGTQGWLVGYKGGPGGVNWHMPRASSACAQPNDKCCRPCATAPAAGCPDNPSDAACAKGDILPLNEDSMNLRCFQQVQRFGIGLLYPTSRYVEAIQSTTVTARFGGAQVPNPLYAPGRNGEPGRERGAVILAGILGVPWQDLSTPDAWDSEGLTYLSARELAAEGRWDVILGDASTGVLPSDALMAESIDPRVGTPFAQKHPLIDATIGAATATSHTNPINGHEHSLLTIRDDLQYACIFPLPAAVACTDDNADRCDCNADEYPTNSPLCEGGSAATDGTQVYGKAYPSVRELEVLKGVGESAVVTSICAKSVVAQDDDPAADPSYGYNPAVSAIVSRVKDVVGARCLPGTLALSETEPGRVYCTVLEARLTPGECDCGLPGRAAALSERSDAVRAELRSFGVCGDAVGASCSDYCVCELEQLAGDALSSCQAGDTDLGTAHGFCYVDPAAGAGDEAAVAGCHVTAKRALRFVGDGLPARGASAFLDCPLPIK